MTTDADAEALPVSANSRRDYWVAELVARGMTEARAELLASSPVDLHAIANALDSGCTPEVAWSIWNVEAVA